MTDPTEGLDRQTATHGSVRLSISVPIELLEQARTANPGLSPSAVFQQALRDAAGCNHEDLSCARCTAPVRRVDVAHQALAGFYVDVQSLVADHARRGATVEGLGRRIKELGQRHRIRQATEIPAPGMTKAERHRAKVRELPTPPPATAPAAATPRTARTTEAG
jgi:hypothetical protein